MGLIVCFFSRCQLSRFTISFSASLQTVLVKAIGLYEFRSFLSLPILRIGLTTENFQLLGISPIHHDLLIKFSVYNFILSGECLKNEKGISSNPGADLLLIDLKIVSSSARVKRSFKRLLSF